MTVSARNAALVIYGGRMGSAVAQALALVVLAREVEPVVLGRVSVAAALIGFVGILADLGLGSAATRTLAHGDLGEASAHARFHSVALLAAAAAVMGALLVGHAMDPVAVPLSFLLLAVWLYVDGKNSLALSLSVASGHEVRAGVSLGFSRLLTLGIYVLLAMADVGTAELRYFSFLILSGITSQLSLGFAGRVPARAQVSIGIRQALRYARPFWMASLSGQARTLDTVVVSMVGSPVMAGLYALPSRAVAPLRLAATSISSVAMPRVAKGDWKQVNSLERSMWRVLVLFLGAILTVWAWGEELLVGLLGDSYAGVGEILAILMLGVLFNIPGALWSGVLQGSGRQHTVAKVGLWLVPAFYLLIVVGVSLGGTQGAAWGVSATFLLQFLIMLMFRVNGRWGRDA